MPQITTAAITPGMATGMGSIANSLGKLAVAEIKRAGRHISKTVRKVD